MTTASGPAAGPIGIADSGVGGLTVVQACRRALPAEEVLYLGDTAFFPYGDRSDAQIRRRSRTVAGWLRRQGVKLIVLACNTASAVALPELRAALDVPVVGVIEAEAAAAACATRAGRVGLLATAATVRSGAYSRAIGDADPTLILTAVACPRLAAIIQEREPGDPALAAAVRHFCEPLARARVDTVILGCTHYPAVAGLVSRYLPGVVLVGAGGEVAGAVASALGRHGLCAPEGGSPMPRFACTGDPRAFAAAGARLLGAPVGPVEVARDAPA